jgi:cystathionine gamma-synthase/methionine-gamma-lyase
MSDEQQTRPANFATTAAHAGMVELGGEAREGEVLPTIKPVYMTTTYVAATIEEMDQVFGGERQGFVYGRYANPNTGELERVVALLESGKPENATAYGSGMATVHASILAAGVVAGDKVVASRDLYGQTWALLNGQMRRLGVDTTFVDVTNVDETLQAIREKRPRLVVVETISNPILRVAPLTQIVEVAHQVGSLVMVDNTFATPYLARPLEHGADIVLHSATKYLGGHGDTMGGVAVAADQTVATELRRVRRDIGGILSPHDAWLITRGIRTLPLRVQRQCENAAQVAEWLARHPAVEKVNYPGFEPKPLKALYGTDLGGGMISFVIRGATRERVFAFMERLRIITPGTTLGDLATLTLYPAMASHRWVDPDVRQSLGISDGLVRLSIGVEDVRDIIADLEQGLKNH